MNVINRKKAAPLLWGLLSLAAIGTSARFSFESLERQDQAHTELEVGIRSELTRYLGFVPSLTEGLNAQLESLDGKRKRMESELGQVCLAAMLTPNAPESFDEALGPRACTEFSDDQLAGAMPYYSTNILEQNRTKELLALLYDDPTSEVDSLNTIRHFTGGEDGTSGSGTTGEISHNDDYVDDFIDYPNEARIVVGTTGSYSPRSFTDPSEFSPSIPIKLQALGWAGLISLLGLIGYQNRREFKPLIDDARVRAEQRRQPSDDEIAEEISQWSDL